MNLLTGNYKKKKLGLKLQSGDGCMQQNCIAAYKFANNKNKGLSPKKEYNMAKKHSIKF